MTRTELIEIGRKIIKAEGTEEELHELMRLFDKNVPRPNGSSMFFWPDKKESKNTDISKYKPTAEEVVDKCLSYKAIQL